MNLLSESLCVTSYQANQSFISVQLLAVWVLSDWMNSGQPSNCQLVELGPGRGTLLKDILRVRIIYVRLALYSGFSHNKLFRTKRSLGTKLVFDL